MNRWVWPVLAIGVAGCQDNSEVVDKLTKLDERLVELEDKSDRTEELVREIGRRVDADQDSMSLDKGDTIAARLGRIEDRLESLAARPTYPRPTSPRTRPPGPDPTEVYSVAIDGAPFEGARRAKVTIVQAFEFA